MIIFAAQTEEVRWDRKGDQKILKVTIPVGVTADIFGKAYGNGTYTINFYPPYTLNFEL